MPTEKPYQSTVVSTVFTCQKCRHQWTPRYDAEPKICPTCKRDTWREPFTRTRP